jgi:hypothetical protein
MSGLEFCNRLAVAVMKKEGLPHFLANAKASAVLSLLYLYDPKNDAGSAVDVSNSSCDA